VLVSVLTAAASVPPAVSAEAVEAELRRLIQENLDAIGRGDREVWTRNALEDLVHVDEEGTVRSRAQLLEELRPLPPGLVGRLTVGALQVARHGDTAVATHEDLEHLDYFGQVIESRWRSTDVWLRTPGGWKLAGQQVLALQADPPAARLAREQLCGYEGTYRLTAEITAAVSCTDEGLSVQRSGRPPVVYRPEVADVFFAPGQPRTRRIFERDAAGRITGFVDRREGHDIRWRKDDTPPGATKPGPNR
jgi:hypothetical protein